MCRKLVIISSLVLAAVAFTGVASSSLEKRAGCAADNCLRGLQRNGTAASLFCATYTTAIATVTTGFPPYVPTSCGSSRVSSACKCIASSTSAPTACSTGQVVVNPSFHDYPNPQPKLSPWAIGHDSGTPGCVFNSASYVEAASDQYFGDPRSIFKVACDYLTYNPGEAEVATSISVLFNNQEAIPKHLCPVCDPAVRSCTYPVYETFSAVVFGPDSGTAELRFVVSQDTVTTPSYPLLLDIVYLEGQGYDGPPYNPPLVGA